MYTNEVRQRISDIARAMKVGANEEGLPDEVVRVSWADDRFRVMILPSHGPALWFYSEQQLMLCDPEYAEWFVRHGVINRIELAKCSPYEYDRENPHG